MESRRVDHRGSLQHAARIGCWATSAESWDSSGVKRTIGTYLGAAKIFSQGDPAADVLYIQDGAVRLSVLSKTGREAVIATLGPREFFGLFTDLSTECSACERENNTRRSRAASPSATPADRCSA